MNGKIPINPMSKDVDLWAPVGITTEEMKKLTDTMMQVASGRLKKSYGSPGDAGLGGSNGAGGTGGVARMPNRGDEEVVVITDKDYEQCEKPQKIKKYHFI